MTYGLLIVADASKIHNYRVASRQVIACIEADYSIVSSAVVETSIHYILTGNKILPASLLAELEKLEELKELGSI